VAYCVVCAWWDEFTRSTSLPSWESAFL
ncbi:hypothetical protein GCK32_011768, partial [Trichostrongylus colubriformis]